MLERRAQLPGGHLDDRAALRAHRVMVRGRGQPVGGDTAVDRQRVQQALGHQRGHRAIDGHHVGRLGAGRQTRTHPLVDLRHRQMPADRLKHRQHLDPRRHPPQPAGAEEVPDALGDGGVEGRRLGRHPFSVPPDNRDCQCSPGNRAPGDPAIDLHSARDATYSRPVGFCLGEGPT